MAIESVHKLVFRYNNQVGQTFGQQLQMQAPIVGGGYNMPTPPIFQLNVPMPQINMQPSSATMSNEAPSVSSSGGSEDLKQKLKALGYNEEKGIKIAQEIKKGIVGFTGWCAKYVSQAIQRATGSRQHANGCGMADAYNGHGFKEITVSDADLKNLPAGCLLSYGRGVSGYSRKAGHAEITLGDGTAGSDGRTRNIRGGARVLIPV